MVVRTNGFIVLYNVVELVEAQSALRADVSNHIATMEDQL